MFEVLGVSALSQNAGATKIQSDADVFMLLLRLSSLKSDGALLKFTCKPFVKPGSRM
jgi:hypothetical protein